jgi:hypothetical protein
MPAGYERLAAADDQERELEAAFEGSDDEGNDNDNENTPLNRLHGGAHMSPDPYAPPPVTPPGQMGTYDFERDYDLPPPGSPPRPSATALPNDIGNSNGQLPSEPIVIPQRSSFLRRALDAVVPSQYRRVSSNSGAHGGGTENDGVFANVMAKPNRGKPVVGENGEIHYVPEETSVEAPPVCAPISFPALIWFNSIYS